MNNQIKININTATSELCEIEGIDANLASKIIRFREENGPFKDVKDLLNVDPHLKNIIPNLLNQILVIPNEKVDINKATRQLIELPGVDEKLAIMIIDYRMQNGSFKKVEDICSVDPKLGILFKQLNHMIVVRKPNGFTKIYNNLKEIGFRGLLSIASDIGTALGSIFSGIALIFTAYVAVVTIAGLKIEMEATKAQLVQLGLRMDNDEFTPFARISLPNISAMDGQAVIYNSPDDFNQPFYALEVTNTGTIVIDGFRLMVTIIYPINLDTSTYTISFPDITFQPERTLTVDITKEILDRLSAIYQNSQNQDVDLIIMKIRLYVIALAQDNYADEQSVEIHLNYQVVQQAQDMIEQYQNSPVYYQP